MVWKVELWNEATVTATDPNLNPMQAVETESIHVHVGNSRVGKEALRCVEVRRVGGKERTGTDAWPPTTCASRPLSRPSRCNSVYNEQVSCIIRTAVLRTAARLARRPYDERVP